MNKRILSFIMLFVVTICFANGCKNNDNKDKSVLVTEDGKEVVATINGEKYTADQLYGDMVNSSANAEYLYEQLEDLLIKTSVLVTDSMRSRVNNEVEKWKKDIKENASISGTSYKKALQDALKSEGVNSVEELVDKKIFALQEEVLKNQYWENNKEEYYKNYLSENYVYHISQILVDIDPSTKKDYFATNLDENHAKKLYDVSNALLNGENFYQVAQRYSDHTSSKANGGDMGLVTLNDTTSVIPNEVKYALASYSIYCENANLNYPEYLDEVYSDGFEVIPQKYVDLLGEKYNESTSVTHLSQPTGTSPLYDRVNARNIIFNRLYNSRTFRLLQSDSEVGETLDNLRMPLIDSAEYSDTLTTSKVIVNEENIPILVVRSDEGIHFISITKSAFAGEEELLKYYSKEVNENDEYVTYLEKAIDSLDREARLAKLEAFANDFAIMKINSNANFAGNEEFIRYDMFNYYLGKKDNGVEFKILDKNIEKIVLQYINAKKEYTSFKIEQVFNEGYESLSNAEEKFGNSENVLKNIPILKCLDNKGCTFTHKDGFAPYTPTTGGEN